MVQPDEILHACRMSALLGLAGAIVGGLLVLLGDAVRRQAERRREEMRSLAEACVAYSVVIGRLFAQARDAFDRGEQPTDGRADRYEASLRFFMTPGSEELYERAMAMVQAYLTYVRSDPSKDDTAAAVDHYFVVQREFEAGIRSIVRRGKAARLPQPPRIPIANG